jgi:hypothetical protein
MYPRMSTCAIETARMTLGDFNSSLEEEGSPGNLNEDFIESKLLELEELEPDWSEFRAIFWLTYARLFELALLCAGNYADHFEFAAAGDLLVNPRLILIHFNSGCKAVKKERHRKLTEQFGYVAGKRDAVVRWLKEQTIPEIVKKPLLVHMHERMERSGYLSEEYLDGVENRMKRISDAIGFLASWHVADSSAFYLRIQYATPSEKSFIEANLCRFDKGAFFELGQDLRKLALDPYQKSRFLRHSTFSCPASPDDGHRSYSIERPA